MIFLLLVLAIGQASAGIFDSMYCGRDNCYEILGVQRTATKKEINKAYRLLARELHPDQNKAENAHVKFQSLVAAYETLRNEVSRNDYDYLLDNPDVYYEHFYRFFKSSTPKVDVMPILIVCLIVLSVLHYLNKQSTYNRVLDSAIKIPMYRIQAKAIAEKEGLLNKKIFKGLAKDEQKALENSILRDIVESQLDIQGGCAKPQWTDILAFQLLMLPYHTSIFAHFHVRRFFKYKVMKQEADETEKDYCTRMATKLSEAQWEMVSEEKKDALFRRELWVPVNLEKYEEEVVEAERLSRISNNKLKQAKRASKKDKASDNYNDDVPEF